MKYIAVLSFFIIYLFQFDVAAAATCLADVASFAQQICGDIANSGSSTIVDANGNLNGGVSNIIKRVVGGASAEINGHVLYDTYVGVARDQLAGVQFKSIDCKERMVAVAVAQVCQTAPDAVHVKEHTNNNQFRNRGLEAAIISISPSKNTVTAMVNLKNISDTYQLVRYCALTSEVNATLDDRRTLTLDSSKVGGIDNGYASKLQYCIDSSRSEIMTQLSSGSSLTVSLTWYSNKDQVISWDRSIAFPFNVIAATVPTKYKDSEDPSAHAGPIHPSVINFPLMPFTDGR